MTNGPAAPPPGDHPTGPADRTTRPAGRTPAPGGSGAAPSGRPTPADLAAAANRSIPDVAAPGLRVLFCGINPSLYSAATGHHFGRPGNRFWPALHRCGFTPRLLHPAEQQELLDYGLGITNVVSRATARADELSADELITGGLALTATVTRLRPAWLAVAGITAYRTAFARPKARLGRQQDTVGGVPVWVLPNPSGLNASWTPARLADAFGELRQAVDECAHPVVRLGAPITIDDVRALDDEQ